MKLLMKAAAAAFVVVGAGQANAAVIDISVFSVSDYLNVTNTSTVLATEDFEGFTLAPNGAFQSADGSISSTVGSFLSAGGTGSGGTVTVPNPNLDGTKIAIRDGDVFGRTSTTDDIAGTPGDASMDQFLDSNDTLGVNWNVDLGGDDFNLLAFVMTDSTDVGATLQVTSGGVTESLSGLGDGNQRLVVVSFDTLVSSASVSLLNNRINDGLSIDDIAVGIGPDAIAPVPVPAAAILLISALGGLAAFKRKKA